MTSSTSARLAPTVGGDTPAPLTRTGRVTALWYLGLAITAALGFLLIRSNLYVDGDPSATATNLVENASLARLGIGLDLGVVITQTLAALWFFRLFRHVDSFAAASLAALGIVNAVAIMFATAFSATALAVAIGDTPAPGGDTAASVQLLYDLNDATWSVGGIFFGLWLIPMGYLVLKSGTMPRGLGWVLVTGGLGYVLSTYVAFMLPDFSGLADALVIPATIGEFWIIGYLLKGMRPPVTATDAIPSVA